MASSKLPADVGDENGETIIDERKIRIKPLPNVKNTIPKPPKAPIDDPPVANVALIRRLVNQVKLCIIYYFYLCIICSRCRQPIGHW